MLRLLIALLIFTISFSTTVTGENIRAISSLLSQEQSMVHSCCSISTSDCQTSEDKSTSDIHKCCSDICHCTCCLHILIASSLDDTFQFVGDIFDDRFIYNSPKCNEYSFSIFIPPIHV